MCCHGLLVKTSTILISENVSFLVASVTLEYRRRLDVSLTLSQVLRTTFKTLLDS